METNLKKLLPILGVVCFSMTSLSAATYNKTNDQSDNSDMMRSAVPPAKYTGENSPCCFISADYTYWTARQDGLNLGSSNVYGGTTLTPIQGTTYYPTWYGNSGFKVALGAFLNHDGWDLAAEYTWFSNKNNPINTSTVGSPNQGVTSIASAVAVGAGNFTTIGSQWSNQFNRIDLDMGRCYWAGHYLSVRPFAGLMSGWETQNLTVETATTVGGTKENLVAQQKWWGIGPYTGVDAAFVFPAGMDSNQFSLFLNSGLAMPWSQYKVAMTTKSNTTTGAYDSDTYNTYYTSTPMLEMSLGLAWESWWNDHSWCFALSAAWENQLYFSHNQIVAAGNGFTAAGGNMILQGLTVKALFAF